jgi:hypothetical protein
MAVPLQEVPHVSEAMRKRGRTSGIVIAAEAAIHAVSKGYSVVIEPFARR